MARGAWLMIWIRKKKLNPVAAFKAPLVARTPIRTSWPLQECSHTGECVDRFHIEGTKGRVGIIGTSRTTQKRPSSCPFAPLCLPSRAYVEPKNLQVAVNETVADEYGTKV